VLAEDSFLLRSFLALPTSCHSSSGLVFFLPLVLAMVVHSSPASAIPVFLLLLSHSWLDRRC